MPSSFLKASVFFLVCLSFHGVSSSLHAGRRTIEDFQTKNEGDFPREFLAYPFQRNKAFKIYRVKREGPKKEDAFLRAQDVPGLTNQVFRRFEWDPKKGTALSWRWRAQSLPKNAAEDNPESNDSACAVYLPFGGWGGKVIKYVWSSTLRPGTVIEVTPNKYYMVVLESGPASLGRWKAQTVDAKKEFETYFQGDFQNPKGFGLLTDGDQTQSVSACDYDDFATLDMDSMDLKGSQISQGASISDPLP